MNTKSKKLILIMPPQQGLLNGFAAGLISLANYVLANVTDIDVEILDLSIYSYEKAKDKVSSSCIDMKDQKLFVGITTTTASYQASLLIARIVKDANPKAVIVFGGHHASADTETILCEHSDIIDLIIIGEGERTICELIHNHPTVENVSGAAYSRDGEPIYTDKSKPLSQIELDSIPITFGDNGLIGTPGKFEHVTYVSARGCPLRCAFCAVGNKEIRTKSIPTVVHDIEVLLKMGFSRIAIEDNFFAHSLPRTKDLCKALAEIKRQYSDRFFWDCQTRVESLAKDEVISDMDKGGCEAVYIGVESVHPKHLLYLNKTKKPDEYLRQLTDIVIPRLLETKIDCYLNLQFGLPEETVEHEKMTLDILRFLGKLADSKGKVITVFPQLHVIYPGTSHYEKGVNEKRFPSDVFESFTKWEFQHQQIIYWLGEHFAHGPGGIPEGILKADLLKERKYDIDENAVFSISTVIHSIDRLTGIRSFPYGDYIVDNRVPLDHNIA